MAIPIFSTPFQSLAKKNNDGKSLYFLYDQKCFFQKVYQK